MNFNNLAKILIVTLVLFFSVNVKAETVEKITVDKLVSTINTGTVTNEIKNMYKNSGDSTATVLAVKTTNGLDIRFSSNKGTGTIPFNYNSSNNSISYIIDKNSESEDVASQVIGAAYMTAWLYEASQYADETIIDKLIGKVTNDATFDIKEDNCNIAVDTVCTNEDIANKKATISFLMSDLYAQKINKAYNISTSDLSKESLDDVNNSKEIKNPNTGAFANLVALSSVTLLSIVSIIIIKRNNKFYRI